jgi:hypothetical protein
MSKLLDKINEDLSKNKLEVRTREARVWLKNHLQRLRVNRTSFLKDKSNHFVRRMLPGRMYFYCYDPKTKESLSFYDRFPMVIPVKKYGDGILGLNLHYLPAKFRIILLDKLYALLNNEAYDETTRLRLTYSLLEGTQRYKEFRPCLKRYLNNYLDSRVIEIPINDWEIMSYLPVEQFIGERASKVQKESIRSVMTNGI